MNRRFRLAALERLRAAALERAARLLADARGDLGRARERHAALARTLADSTVPERETPDGVLAAAEHRAHLREQIQLCAGDEDRAQVRVGEAVAGWRTAKAALGAVESLHDRHRLALVAADARTEQRSLDDLAGRTGRTTGGGRTHGDEDERGAA